MFLIILFPLFKVVWNNVSSSLIMVIILFKDNNNNLLVKETQKIENNNKFEIKLDNSGVVDIYILYSGIQFDDVIILDNLKI